MTLAQHLAINLAVQDLLQVELKPANLSIDVHPIISISIMRSCHGDPDHKLSRRVKANIFCSIPTNTSFRSSNVRQCMLPWFLFITSSHDFVQQNQFNIDESISVNKYRLPEATFYAIPEITCYAIPEAACFVNVVSLELLYSLQMYVFFIFILEFECIGQLKFHFNTPCLTCFHTVKFTANMSYLRDRL